MKRRNHIEKSTQLNFHQWAFRGNKDQKPRWYIMGKMATTVDDKLPEFQKYLLDKRLAPARNVPFYAHWVSRFLDYARKKELPTREYQEAAVLGFLDSLKSDTRVHDW
jgi:hypothetical protein